MVKVIAIWGVVAIVSAIAGCHRRRRQAARPLVLGGLELPVPPMLLILLVMPSNKGPRPRRPGLDELEERARPTLSSVASRVLPHAVASWLPDSPSRFALMAACAAARRATGTRNGEHDT